MAPKNHNNRRHSNASDEDCVICSKTITENDRSVQCDKCKRWIHETCTKLNQKDTAALFTDSSLSFMCAACKKKNKNIDASSSISSESEIQFQRILKELAGIKQSINDVKLTQSSLESKFDSLQKELESVKNENKDIKKSFSSLLFRLKTLENVRLRSQIFFKTPTNLIANKDPGANVIEIGASVGINISRNDIKSAVIQTKLSNDEFSLSKLEFRDEFIKFQLLKNRANIKKVFKDAVFFDVLSRENADLFKSAKILLTKGFAVVYHHSGRIFVKKTAESNPYHIKCKADIAGLTSNDNMNVRVGRGSA